MTPTQNALPTTPQATGPAAGRPPVLAVADVVHTYGKTDAPRALDAVSLSVPDGEFLTLLGPSGCGKTTLLRAIGGFIRPTSGSIRLRGEDVTNVPPHRRDVNMVFQRVTLFPHLDVFDNVAFGLRVAGVRKSEIKSRVAEALGVVRMGEFIHRSSSELSGGQQQRVSLARAIVNRPKVLLLDEPLSALDLKIRLEMEVELRRVHRETGATFVYVTHDQREALALSDRIAVFNRGRIEQIASPDEIYRRPASAFAARFVGDANVLPGEVLRVENGVAHVRLLGRSSELRTTQPVRSGPVEVVLRQEALRVALGEGRAGDGLAGRILDVGFRGGSYSYRIAVPELPEPLKAEVRAAAEAPLPVGADVRVSWGSDAGWLLQEPATSGAGG